MILTGQKVINSALTKLGLLEQGGNPSVSDSQDGLDELNRAWDAWSVDEDMIYAVIAQRFPWAASFAFYTIGAGAQLNAQMPARIYKARWLTATGGAISSQSIGAAGEGYATSDTGFILLGIGTIAAYTVSSVDSDGAVTGLSITTAGTGYQPGYGYATQPGGAQPGDGKGLAINILSVTAGGSNRNELEVVPAERYYSHRDLAASAQVPDELYPDYNPDGSGFEKLYAYPVPNAAGTVELDTAVPFTTWTLTDNYNVPPAWSDTLSWALAWRLMPSFGAAVDPAIAANVETQGTKAEARLAAANRFNRQRQAPAPIAATPEGAE
jgi:hypothetical protein